MAKVGLRLNLAKTPSLPFQDSPPLRPYYSNFIVFELSRGTALACLLPTSNPGGKIFAILYLPVWIFYYMPLFVCGWKNLAMFYPCRYVSLSCLCFLSLQFALRTRHYSVAESTGKEMRSSQLLGYLELETGRSLQPFSLYCKECNFCWSLEFCFPNMTSLILFGWGEPIRGRNLLALVA